MRLRVISGLTYMKKELILHFLNTVIWGVVFAGLLNYFEFHGYYAGFTVGAFYVTYYHVGYYYISIKVAN